MSDKNNDLYKFLKKRYIRYVLRKKRLENRVCKKNYNFEGAENGSIDNVYGGEYKIYVNKYDFIDNPILFECEQVLLGVENVSDVCEVSNSWKSDDAKCLGSSSGSSQGNVTHTDSSCDGIYIKDNNSVFSSPLLRYQMTNSKIEAGKSNHRSITRNYKRTSTKIISLALAASVLFVVCNKMPNVLYGNASAYGVGTETGKYEVYTGDAGKRSVASTLYRLYGRNNRVDRERLPGTGVKIKSLKDKILNTDIDLVRKGSAAFNRESKVKFNDFSYMKYIAYGAFGNTLLARTEFDSYKIDWAGGFVNMVPQKMRSKSVAQNLKIYSPVIDDSCMRKIMDILSMPKNDLDMRIKINDAVKDYDMMAPSVEDELLGKVFLKMQGSGEGEVVTVGVIVTETAGNSSTSKESISWKTFVLYPKINTVDVEIKSVISATSSVKRINLNRVFWVVRSVKNDNKNVVFKTTDIWVDEYIRK